MGSVPGLDDRIQKVIEAAIAAEMSYYGYSGTCEKGFEGYSKATEELPLSEPITIVYPSGDVYQWGYRADHVEAMFAGDYAHSSDLFGKWDEEIRQNFERFDDLPSPSSFSWVVERLGILATALDAGGVYLGGAGSDSRPQLGNGDLAGCLEGMRRELSGFKGQTIEDLNGAYLSRVDVVIAGQQVLACSLLAVVVGEREVWESTGRDLCEIADSAEAAFLHYAGSGGGSGDGAKTGFLVLGAIATALSFTGVGMTVTAGALAAVSIFMPDAPSGPELTFAGDSVGDIHGNLLVALSDQCRVVSEVERALADCAEAAIAHAASNPDYYDFATRGSTVPFLEAREDAAYLGPGETLEVQGPEMREAAAYLETIAEVMRRVQRDLPTLNTWAWDRNLVVGYGRYGHHREAEALLVGLDDLVVRSAQTMTEVASKMVAASYDFERTEDQVAADLRAHQDRLVDPTPNQDVPYGHVSVP